MAHLPVPRDILGVKVHPLSEMELLSLLTEWLFEVHPKRAYYVNVFGMNLAALNPKFKDSLNRADLVFCDGYGVFHAARLLGHPLPARMTPPDWIDAYLERVARHEKSVYLLGDEPGVAQKCGEVMKARHPTLKIAGSYHGFFDAAGDENDAVLTRIRESGASLLLVGMGMPRQEFWIDAHFETLRIPVTLPVGAMFRWYSGVEKRPPRIVTDCGLEWAARLARHPVKHFRRYMVGNPTFAVRVIRELLANRRPKMEDER